MHWVEVFAVFVVCHVVGDFIVQTDWQAVTKRRGLEARNAEGRRALLSHVTAYTVCFVPALVWLAGDIGAWALAIAPIIFVPHLIQDDTRALIAFNRSVKGTTVAPGEPLYTAIDQSFHIVTLFATAVLASHL